MEVRCGLRAKDQTRKVYVHMLNGTMCATERALCCLVENWQTPEVSDTNGHRIYMCADREIGAEHTPCAATIHARKAVPAVGEGAAQGSATEEKSIDRRL